jgi:hypothetical protein
MQLFGVRGKELSGIFKNGRESLEAFTKSMATMSRESITRLSEMQEKIERFQRKFKEIAYDKPLGGYANYWQSREVEGAIGDVEKNAFETNWVGVSTGKTSGGGTIAQQASSDANQVVSQLEGFLPAIREAAQYAKERSTWQGQSDETTAYMKELAKYLSLQVKKMEAGPSEKKAGLEIPLVKELLTSSSLQAIGGGDISSVLSGTIQASMLTAMQETAANTGKLAAETGQPDPNPPNVAK